MMETLLDAILNDDRPAVTKLLKADAALSMCAFKEARLYQSKIFHWMYVGDTALHLAAAGYRVEMVRTLLAAGADPNAVRNMRRSGPLHYAADGFITGPVWDAQRQVNTIAVLLQAGADIHAQDKNGASPLHRAVRTRSAAAVQSLLDAGADPTLKNKPGSTPFHLAVQNTGRGGSGTEEARAAQRQIIETFLSAGVSTSLKDGKGKTVLDCAKQGWIQEILGASSS